MLYSFFQLLEFSEKYTALGKKFMAFNAIQAGLHSHGDQNGKLMAYTTRNIDYPESSVIHFCIILDIWIRSESIRIMTAIQDGLYRGGTCLFLYAGVPVMLIIKLSLWPSN